MCVCDGHGVAPLRETYAIGGEFLAKVGKNIFHGDDDVQRDQ
jgi:hypothetical protein